MKHIIKYSKAAVRDLDRVWSEVFEASALFPESGTPLYYEDSFTGYYYVVFKAYIVFYRLDDDAVLVDRILSGKSDYMRRLTLMRD